MRTETCRQKAGTRHVIIHGDSWPVVSATEHLEWQYFSPESRLLKNGIFFNIIRSVGNICTLEGEHYQCRNKSKNVYESFHNPCPS